MAINAQTENTGEIQLPSPSHSPGTAQPSSPSQTGPVCCLPQRENGVGGEWARWPVVQGREDRPRPGPSGCKATGGFCPGREASAPSRLSFPRRLGGPRPLPRPLRPLNLKPPEGRRDPALLRTQVSPHGPPPGPGHGPHKPPHAPRLLPGSLTFAAGSCQTTSP